MTRRRLIIALSIFAILIVATVISYYVPTPGAWKTYTNDAWGVTFSYPPSFEQKTYHAAEVAFLGVGGTIDLFVIPQKPQTKGNVQKTLVGDRIGYTRTETRDKCDQHITETALGERTLRIAFIACEGEAYPIDRDTTFIKRILKTFQFVDRGSGWKVYRDAREGYRIAYPEDFTIEKKGQDTVGFLAPWEIATRAMPEYTDQPLGYYVRVESIHPKYSLEQWLNGKYKDCAEVCTTQKAVIGKDQLPGYLVHEDGLAEGSYTFYAKVGDRVYSLTTFWSFEIDDTNSTFNTMLASFQVE